jgi:hypothetical protein
MGLEIDRLGISFHDARFVAYGRTRPEQRRRLDEARVKKERSWEESRYTLRKHRGPLRMIRVAISVHVPEELVSGPPETLQAFLVANVQAIVTHLHRPKAKPATVQSELAPEAAG